MIQVLSAADQCRRDPGPIAPLRRGPSSAPNKTTSLLLLAPGLYRTLKQSALCVVFTASVLAVPVCLLKIKRDIDVPTGQHNECRLTAAFPKGVCAAENAEVACDTRLGKRGLAPEDDLPLVKGC
jgi:hypothetical protein